MRITTEELAKEICLSRSWVWHNWPQWVVENNVRVYKVANKILFNKEDVDRVMETKFLITA